LLSQSGLQAEICNVHLGGHRVLHSCQLAISRLDLERLNQSVYLSPVCRIGIQSQLLQLRACNILEQTVEQRIDTVILPHAHADGNLLRLRGRGGSHSMHLGLAR